MFFVYLNFHLLLTLSIYLYLDMCLFIYIYLYLDMCLYIYIYIFFARTPPNLGTFFTLRFLS